MQQMFFQGSFNIQYMFDKQYFLLHIKLIIFETQILNLDCRESCSLHFENIFSRDTTEILFGKNLNFWNVS